ncbi:MAG: GNAT family N-acetyltransferase [Ghiorsea sp.]|nr:GNAT family N-acetyltransferase [Ghiorsea sp.]
MNLKLAEIEQAEEICNLVNIAYRGDIGWTKETDIVGGDRTTILEIKSAIQKNNSYLLIATQGNEIISCICLEKEESQVYIGLFSVHPKSQGKGVGKSILSQVEEYAFSSLRVTKLIMVVVSQRVELISFYERR